MRVTIFLFLFVPSTFICYPLLCQVIENFENSSADLWIQSTDNRWDACSFQPINGKYSLHHIYDNTGPGHDQIALAHNALLLDSSTSTWKFKIRHGYNPSSANNWGVFLVSDKSSLFMHPGADVTGYVLGVNFTGNDDLIKLWKITSGNILTCEYKFQLAGKSWH